jgi:hypothetical protein
MTGILVAPRAAQVIGVIFLFVLLLLLVLRGAERHGPVPKGPPPRTRD